MSMDDETDSRYTTGDIAKLTGVSVRTVQYYGAKGLLIPNEISDGGRRLYGTAEVERMRVILFLKGLGFKLEQIRSILSDERPERVLVDLLDQQTASLQSGIAEQKQRLDDCLQLRKALTVSASDFVSSTLTDMATVMNTTTTHSLRHHIFGHTGNRIARDFVANCMPRHRCDDRRMVAAAGRRSAGDCAHCCGDEVLSLPRAVPMSGLP